jgi:mono/diheme cytochrome c family protein
VAHFLKLVVAFAVFGLMVAGVVRIFMDPSERPVVISAYSPPVLVPDEVTHDLGTMDSDTVVHHTYHLFNEGGKPLKIHDVEASCGCTVAKLAKNVVQPGEQTTLSVSLDTSIKVGHVKKTITIRSNDPEHPKRKLFLVGNVVPQMDAHGPMKVKDPLVLFKGECATCHVNRGIGKTGKSLFAADCAMCHGMSGQGAFAPSLMTPNYKDEATVARLRKIITEGSPTSPTMPPYSKAHGGPLSESEIDSIMTFLKLQSELKALEAEESAADAAEEQAETQASAHS